MSKLKRKRSPEIDWNNIAPPYKDYAYFDGHASFPFRYGATLFDLVNAWWLIESATLAYAEENVARPIFEAAGFTEVKYFSAESTQCYVVGNERFVITAFRGTESRQREGQRGYQDIIADLKADADIRLVDSGQGGKVHRGFKDALDEVWKDLVAYLRSIHTGNRSLWVTGHSLGAALATLAADRYGNVQGLYTFGSPRVGDADFKTDFLVNAYRFVNNNDIVTRVPPEGFYHHVGELKYIDNSGDIHDNTSRWSLKADELGGRIKNVFNNLGHIRKGFLHLVPDGLKDHVPLYYAVHIWNSLPGVD